MFFTLMRKELRLHRMAIIIAIAVAVVGDLLLPATSYAAEAYRNEAIGTAKRWLILCQSVYSGSGMALAATCLFAAAVGGGSAATERRERWGDLAAMLPTSRVGRSLATLTVAVALTLGLFTFHGAIVIGLDHSGAVYSYGCERHVLTMAALTVGALGLSRLASIWMRSPALLVTVVCGTLIAGLMLAYFADESFARGRIVRNGETFVIDREFLDFSGRYLRVVALLGVIAAGISVPIASRRVEP